MANSTDQRLDQLQQSSTVDFVVGTLANGDSVRISKADLASVLGELLGNPLCHKGTIIDKSEDELKSYIDEGIYKLQNCNFPSLGLYGKWGTLKIIVVDGYIEQYISIAYTDSQTTTLLFRQKIDDNDFTPFRKL